MQFTITCQNSSIFDGGNIGGTITLKYPGGVIEIGSGATVTITGDSSLSISDLIVSVSGFINSYVLTTNGYGTPLTTRDENGFKAFSITSKNITLINHLIPSDFDTVTFARCIGNNIEGVDSGDGTVQRYDHSDRTVQVGTLAYPDKPTTQTLNFDQSAAQTINDAREGPIKKIMR